jgi:hypothetical protein
MKAFKTKGNFFDIVFSQFRCHLWFQVFFNFAMNFHYLILQEPLLF